MTKVKLCGLSQSCDIGAVNELQPDYIGFVFAPKSTRYISPEKAATLKGLLSPSVKTVGVFVREKPENVARLLENGTIDIAQLHGGESEDYIRQLRGLSGKPLIKAFRVDTKEDVKAANICSADYVLLDSGQGGTGKVFDWELLAEINRPYFLAGGLNADNVRNAIDLLHPYAVDVSSGIETDGHKDVDKMAAFMRAAGKNRHTHTKGVSQT